MLGCWLEWKKWYLKSCGGGKWSSGHHEIMTFNVLLVSLYEEEAGLMRVDVQFCVWTGGSSKSWGYLTVDAELMGTKQHSWDPWQWTCTMTTIYWMFYETKEVEGKGSMEKGNHC